MSDERIIICPNCGGDGGFERINESYPADANGSPRTSWDPCIECDSQGEIIIVTSLVDFYEPDLTGPAHAEHQARVDQFSVMGADWADPNYGNCRAPAPQKREEGR